jgi:hypothetical protein
MGGYIFYEDIRVLKERERPFMFYNRKCSVCSYKFRVISHPKFQISTFSMGNTRMEFKKKLKYLSFQN